MLRFNILEWCDYKMSFLKSRGVQLKNGVPQLKKEYLYTRVPENITPYPYRSDIAEDEAKNSLLSFFLYDDRLWARLQKIDDDIKIFKKYGGIVGFDLSPCINMLRPRQRLSILINALHACYCGEYGIKILPNYRSGDLGTLCFADFFPDHVPFIIGTLGCSGKRYSAYGEYAIEIILDKKKPSKIYIYGSLRKKIAVKLIKRYMCSIIVYPDRRNKVRNAARKYGYFITKSGVQKKYDFAGGFENGA